jgi:hypothetical protein
LGAKTAIDIDKLRDGYRPAARRGAILFFILADLSTINTMYQYSLDAYLGVFELSLKKSMPDAILQKRLKNIMDTLTHNIYNYGCTGENKKRFFFIILSHGTVNNLVFQVVYIINIDPKYSVPVS